MLTSAFLNKKLTNLASSWIHTTQTNTPWCFQWLLRSESGHHALFISCIFISNLCLLIPNDCLASPSLGWQLLEKNVWMFPMSSGLHKWQERQTVCMHKCTSFTIFFLLFFLNFHFQSHTNTHIFSASLCPTSALARHLISLVTSATHCYFQETPLKNIRLDKVWGCETKEAFHCCIRPVHISALPLTGG